LCGIIFGWFFPLRFLAYPGLAFFVEWGKMKKGAKGNRYLSWTANTLLLLVLVHPIFHTYQDLAHSEILSSLNHIESLHPEDLSVSRDDHHYTGDAVISALAGTMVPETARVFGHLPYLLFPAYYLDPQNLVLRC
jgi:hypothetical protein